MKMKPVIIFGTGDFADVVSFVFLKNPDAEIAAYTVNAEYIKEPSYHGRKLLPFEGIEEQFPPSDYDFVPGFIGKKMFTQREAIFRAIREKGYHIRNVIDPSASVDILLPEGGPAAAEQKVNGSADLPAGETGCADPASGKAGCADPPAMGEGNIILAHTSIEAHSRIGSGNIIWQNVVLPHHNVIGDFNNLAPSVSLSGYSRIGSHCFVGNNVCVKNRVYIYDYAYIGAGSYVAHDVPENTVIVPARSYALEGRTGFDFL